MLLKVKHGPCIWEGSKVGVCKLLGHLAISGRQKGTTGQTKQGVQANVYLYWYWYQDDIQWWGEKVFCVQVGRMGCVPACGRNSNSRNVSRSQPAPPGSAFGYRRYINGRSIKKCLHITSQFQFGYIRHSKDRLNTEWRVQQQKVIKVIICELRAQEATFFFVT